MATLTQTAATPGQLEQIGRVVKDAIRKSTDEVVDEIIKDANLSKDGAQRVHANGDELSAEIREVVAEVLKRKLQDLSVTDKYKNEERQSNYGYLSGYKPKGQNSDLVAQGNRLRELFPGLGLFNQDWLTKVQNGEVQLPKRAEGWFAVPNIWKPDGLAIFGSSYNEALQKALDVLKQTVNGRFHNYREGQLDAKRLRQSVRTKKFYQELSEAQGHPDILIIPAQFGLLHRGRSVRRALEVMSCAPGEVGLGAFTGVIMVLTHPNRLQNVDDLWIDFAGDEYDDPGSVVRWDHCPYLVFSGAGVKFGTDCVDDAGGDYGSVSGFLPQISNPCVLNS